MSNTVCKDIRISKLAANSSSLYRSPPAFDFLAELLVEPILEENDKTPRIIREKFLDALLVLERARKFDLKEETEEAPDYKPGVSISVNSLVFVHFRTCVHSFTFDSFVTFANFPLMKGITLFIGRR